MRLGQCRVIGAFLGRAHLRDEQPEAIDVARARALGGKARGKASSTERR